MTQSEFMKAVNFMQLSPAKERAIRTDFLPTCAEYNDNIQETEKYFFKRYGTHSYRELRYFKKSGRVTVSSKITNP